MLNVPDRSLSGVRFPQPRLYAGYVFGQRGDHCAGAVVVEVDARGEEPVQAVVQ